MYEIILSYKFGYVDETPEDYLISHTSPGLKQIIYLISIYYFPFLSYLHMFTKAHKGFSIALKSLGSSPGGN